MGKISRILGILLYILLIIFAIFVIYQLIIKILGGSWTTEDVLISLSMLTITSLFVIAGFLINQARILGRLESNLNNLKDSLIHLAQDFKEHKTRKKH